MTKKKEPNPYNPAKEGALLALGAATMGLYGHFQLMADKIHNEEHSEIDLQDMLDWIDTWKHALRHYRRHWGKAKA